MYLHQHPSPLFINDEQINTIFLTLATGILGYVSQKKQEENLYMYIFHTIKPSSGEERACMNFRDDALIV